jgi:hypothetical protein
VELSVSAEALREILDQVAAPKMQDRIREAVAFWLRVPPDDAAEMTWERLVVDSDVILHGGSEGTYYLLRENNQELRMRDPSELRKELVRLMTPVGAIEVAVDFARDLLADPRNEKVIEAAASGAAGTSGLSPSALLIVILVWLVALGLPLADAELPARDQGVVTNELATVGLALAATWRALDKSKGNDKQD